MAYPMKVDRKKPREELDIVNIIEWRLSVKDDDRWFLMVRRPDGGKDFFFAQNLSILNPRIPLGLLAGLYEFPTSPNVSKTISQRALNEIPKALLHQLLQPSAPSCGESESTDAFRIKFVKPVQDVVHVFSHIKKTYRPQWVVLEGGITPPSVKRQTDADKGEKQGLDDDCSRQINWVKMDDVANTKFVASPHPS